MTIVSIQAAQMHITTTETKTVQLGIHAWMTRNIIRQRYKYTWAEHLQYGGIVLSALVALAALIVWTLTLPPGTVGKMIVLGLWIVLGAAWYSGCQSWRLLGRMLFLFLVAVGGLYLCRVGLQTVQLNMIAPAPTVNQSNLR